MLEELRQELPDRGNTHPLDPVRSLLGEELGRVPGKHDGRLVAGLDGSVDAKVEG
jgi:hypothetical protein